ncbi:putative Protein kinase domain [Paratrimastix pyriformis]|uniref:Transmembrane protein 115 n=1 Tax=Paratrimastix pyriformis TaxID=342808 RepID=A0ABQ8UQ02_9EUKA|nr:putative Protein kinase domain [Paratrimastix pyriformis]
MIKNLFAPPLPRLSTILATCMIGCSFISMFIAPVCRLFCLMPSRTIIQLCLWNLLTGAFFQENVIQGILTALVVFSAGKMLEPLWGRLIWGLFLITVHLATSSIMCVELLLLYSITGAEDLLSISLSCWEPLLAGFVVALKQRQPEEPLFSTSPLLRYKHLPLLLLCGSIPFALILLSARSVIMPLQVINGTLIAWVYLRFFQTLPQGIIGDQNGSAFRGDRSPSFAFITFFPEWLQPTLTIFGNILGRLWNYALIPCRGRRTPRAAILPAGMGLSESERERQRQRGLQVLQSALGTGPTSTSAAAAAAPSPPQPQQASPEPAPPSGQEPSK